MNDEEFDREPGAAREAVHALFRRKWVILATMAVCILASVAYTLSQAKTYRATSKVLVVIDQPGDPLVQQSNNASVDQRTVANEVDLMSSAEAQDAYLAAYQKVHGKNAVPPLPASAVNVATSDQTTDAIKIWAVGKKPTQVRDLVNDYTVAWVLQRRADEVKSLDSAIQAATSNVDQINAKITSAETQLTALNEQIASAPASQLPSLQAQRTNLTAALQPYTDQLTTAQQQLSNLQLSRSIRQNGVLKIIATASTPTKPEQSPLLNIAGGAVIGLLLGIGLALLLNQFDDTLRTDGQLERITNLPTLGILPAEHWRKKGSSVAPLPNTDSPLAESFRMLRTAVSVVGLESPVRVLQITSPNAAEGKTVTASNLAIAYADAGKTVIVVGCDLRRPRLDAMLAAPSGVGLTSVILGDVALEDAIIQVEDRPRLSLLPSGSPTPRPSELLGTNRMRNLIKHLAEQYDLVILDCPPVLPVADSLVLAPMADATLLVTYAGKTSRRGLKRTLELLRQVDARLVGAVLNGVRSTETYSTPYSNSYVTASKDSRRGADRDVAADDVTVQVTTGRELEVPDSVPEPEAAVPADS